MLVDPTTGAPETGLTVTALDLQYIRNLTAAAAKVDATAGSTTAHSDNTIVEVDGTSSPGLYKVDWPDAAFATGVDKVLLVVSGAAIAPAVEEIQLVDIDVEDATRMGLTALPNADADANNGLVTGDGSVTFTAGVGNRPAVDVEGVSGSTAEADRLEAALTTANGIDINLGFALDTTPTADTVGDALYKAASSLRLLRTTATSNSTDTIVELSAAIGTDADDEYNGHLLVAFDASDSERPAVRVINDWTASNNRATLVSALPFTPVAGDRVEVWTTSDTSVLSEISKLTTGFGAASPDTLQGYLKAMMDKTASTPAGLGTYDPAADSQEAIAECCADVQGAGFSTGTDSLKEIRDAIDTLVAPSVVGSSALSGSGFLSDCVSLVRKATDEPSVVPKYTDGDIVELVQGAFDTVLADININTDHPVLARVNISVADGKQSYTLPPHCAEVWRIAKILASTNTMQWNVWPGSYYNVTGDGFKLEGNTIRLLRDWNSSDTLEVMFVPNGEVAMHKATADANDASTVTFPSSVTDGTLDTRENCYAGYLLRILSDTSGIVQERIISAYDNDTRIATVIEDFDPTPSGTVVYEVVPQYSRLLKHVVCTQASIDLLAQEGNSKRMQTLGRTYATKISALRRFISKKQARFPHHMDGDTEDNMGRAGFWGEFA